MPLFPTQLHRCLGGTCCNATFFRSGIRPLCATVTAASRHFDHRLSATKSDSNGSSSSGQGFGKPSTNQQKKQKPEVSSTTDALLRSLGEVSSSAGRDAGSTNMVLGANDSEEKWRELDEKVNQYPGHRDFKAIGSGGDDFKQTIIRAVEDIVGPVNQDRVMERPSSQGKFISVTLRDVKVENPDQVLAVYAAMRKDKRLRYYL